MLVLPGQQQLLLLQMLLLRQLQPLMQQQLAQGLQQAVLLRPGQQLQPLLRTILLQLLQPLVLRLQLLPHVELLGLLGQQRHQQPLLLLLRQAALLIGGAWGPSQRLQVPAAAPQTQLLPVQLKSDPLAALLLRQPPASLPDQLLSAKSLCQLPPSVVVSQPRSRLLHIALLCQLLS
jgi:hypothetical protein